MAGGYFEFGGGELVHDVEDNVEDLRLFFSDDLLVDICTYACFTYTTGVDTHML